ncbi:MAG: 2-isopropylmalate synthase [Candidatus Buchananbacteria bacterium]
MSNKIYIFDTTLRDGQQSACARQLSLEENLMVARQLAALNVDIIEAGFPIASPKIKEAVTAIAQTIQGPTICGLARALEPDISECWDAVRFSTDPRIHTFIATSDIHVNEKFKSWGNTLAARRDRVIAQAVLAVKLAKSKTADVEFSAEDAGRTDLGYLIEVVAATIAAGATTINIPDTTGFCTGIEMYEKIKILKERVPGINQVVLSVHCHNDLGQATPNSLMAIKAGARQIEGCINGVGERAGNTPLEEVIVTLMTRADYYGVGTQINTEQLKQTSDLVARLLAIPVQPNKAIVGKNAFQHAAGIHVHGVTLNPEVYEAVDAGKIGQQAATIVLTRQTGKHGVQNRLTTLGYQNLGEEFINQFYEQKFLPLADKVGEVTDQHLRALMDEPLSNKPTEMIIYVNYDIAKRQNGWNAWLKVKLNPAADLLEEAGQGDGPIDALISALTKISAKLDLKFSLTKFETVGVARGANDLGEATVVLQDNGLTALGRGSSTDTIEAAIKAAINAVNQLLVARTEPPIIKDRL